MKIKLMKWANQSSIKSPSLDDALVFSAWLIIFLNLAWSIADHSGDRREVEKGTSQESGEVVAVGADTSSPSAAAVAASDGGTAGVLMEDAATFPSQQSVSNQVSPVYAPKADQSRPARAVQRHFDKKRQINFTRLIVEPGDTLQRMLRLADVDISSSHLVAKAISRIYNVNRFKPGQEISIGIPKGKRGLNVRGSDKAKALDREAGECLVLIVGEREIRVSAVPARSSKTNRRRHPHYSAAYQVVRSAAISSVGNSAAGLKLAKTGKGKVAQEQARQEPGIDAQPPTKVRGSSVASQVSTHHLLATVVPALGRNVSPSRPRPTMIQGEVKNGQSLATAAARQGVPAAVVSVIRHVMSSMGGNAGRGVTTSGKFTILYEEKENTANVKESSLRFKRKQMPSLLYFSLKPIKNSGNRRAITQKLEIYRYRTDGGENYYLLKDGSQATSSISSRSGGAAFQRPVAGGAMSSGFGSRWHPIHKSHRMHYGLDYRAPYGTKVGAAADGVIASQGYNGAFGKTIRIRHDRRYVTLYAHMSGFAPGVHVGSFVRKGQVIGYIGKSGLATGAHLHFELHDNGRRVDPQRIIAVSGTEKRREILNTKQQVFAFKQQQYAINNFLATSAH